jgi:hypothetical protein
MLPQVGVEQPASHAAGDRFRRRWLRRGGRFPVNHERQVNEITGLKILNDAGVEPWHDRAVQKQSNPEARLVSRRVKPRRRTENLRAVRWRRRRHAHPRPLFAESPCSNLRLEKIPRTKKEIIGLMFALSRKRKRSGAPFHATAMPALLRRVRGAARIAPRRTGSA